MIEIDADLKTSPGLERSLGFQQIIKQFPGIKVFITDSNDFGNPKSNFSKLLESLPNVDYVYSFNDLIAHNAWKLAKAKGLENKIKFIGVDGLNGPFGGIQLVKDGILEATVLYPTGGSEAIRLALKIANKEIVPKNNKLNTILINSLNADIMSNQFDKITIQQSDIEQQQRVIKNQEQKYSSQNNLLKLLFSLFMLTLCLAVHSVYSRITISRKNKELEITNKKIKSQRNEIKKNSEELKQSNESRLNFFMGLSHEFKAEALIQLNRFNEALPIINRIRARAAVSTTMPLAAGASNVYKIAQYASFPSKDYAFKALMFERRLEFGMEGPRFFDLVRWGIAEPVLNAYLSKEKIKRDFLSNAKFTAGRDEYYPIPQREIDFTGGLYIQNPGY